MQSATKKAIDVRTLILEEMSGHQIRPIDLISRLQQHGIPENRTQDVLADLIEEQEVELTPDRHFRVVQPKEHPH